MKLSFLSKSVFRSKTNAEQITSAEKLIGYLLGPVGPALLGSFLSSYLNVYYTDILHLGNLWNGFFLSLISLIAQCCSLLLSILMGQIIDITESSAGKARPWVLLSGPLLTVSTILLFILPEVNTAILFGYMLLLHLFRAISATMYSLSHSLMIPLATTDTLKKNILITFSNISGMIPGFIIGVILPGVLLPVVGVRIERWLILVLFFSVLTLPLTTAEYYFTRERITETTSCIQNDKPTFSKNCICCFRCRNWRLLTAYVAVLAMVNALSGKATVYYCNWVIGSYNDGVTQVLFLAVGNAPYGFGLPLYNCLCRKFDRYKVIFHGLLIATFGTLLCLFQPKNLSLVLLGQIIKTLGMIPSTFSLPALLSDAVDDVQRESGMRFDGFTSSAHNCAHILSGCAALGILNIGMGTLGYTAPINGYSVQSMHIQNFFIFCAIGCQLVAYPLAALLISGIKRKSA